MAIVSASFSMSLDGFIALPDDSVGPLFDWYEHGDVEFILRKNPQRGQSPEFEIGQRDRLTRRHQAGRLDALECVDQLGIAGLASEQADALVVAL